MDLYRKPFLEKKTGSDTVCGGWSKEKRQFRLGCSSIMETCAWETELKDKIKLIFWRVNIWSFHRLIFSTTIIKADFQKWNKSATGQKLIDFFKNVQAMQWFDKWKVIFNAYPQNCDRLFQSMMWGIGEQFWQTGYRTVIGVLRKGDKQSWLVLSCFKSPVVFDVYEDFWDHF